ncbi:hypothetical protein PYCC9005_002545 [Savitreella phatthalungensis]
METTHADSFFQTDEARAKAAQRARERDNVLGAPSRLSTKVLAVIPDAHSPAKYVFVAEAGGHAKHIRIDATPTAASSQPFKRPVAKSYIGHTAPCTALLHLPDNQVTASDGEAQGAGLLITGSWDKTIKVWDVQSGECLATGALHDDFVKSLVWVPSAGSRTSGFVVSGSSDSSARVWDISDVRSTGELKCVAVVRAHTRGIESLAYLPHLDLLLTGSSESSVRVWEIDSKGNASEKREPFWGHDTSIYALVWDDNAECLWTASADKHARQFAVTQAAEGLIFTEDLKVEHPDYVQCIVPLHGLGLFATGCRDGLVRLFDQATGQLREELQGHYDAVSGVAAHGHTLVSVSLDGTLRLWDVTPSGLARHDEEQRKFRQQLDTPSTPTTAQPVLDDDELAELEALMEDD